MPPAAECGAGLALPSLRWALKRPADRVHGSAKRMSVQTVLVGALGM